MLTTLAVSHARNVRIIDERPAGFLTALRGEVRRLLALGFSQRHAIDHALLRALVLGDNDPQLRDVQRDFVRTGTSHHLAISGMHVAILGMCVLFLCRALLVPPRRSAWIFMGFVVAYGAVALPAPPVTRSIILCLLLAIGILLGCTVNGVHLLAITVFVMLCYQPLDLYSAGFQLSFGTVLGMMLLSRKMQAWLWPEKTRDERLMEDMRWRTWWGRALGAIRRSLVEAVATGLVAWLVSAPVICWHFDQLNPWAIPASLLLAIPVLFSLIGGFLKIALTAILPSLAPVWAAIVAQSVALMRWSVEMLAKLPGSDVPLPAPPVWAIVLYYALLALPFIPSAPARLRVLLRVGPVTAGLAVLLLPLLSGFASTRAAHGETRFTLLAVGAGQCAVLELSDGRTFLFDAGSASMNDAATRVLSPYLRRNGHSRIDGVFLSHPDADHTNALAELGPTHSISAVYTSQHFADFCTDTAASAMLQRVRGLGCPMRALQPGERLDLDVHNCVEILGPGAAPPNRNDGSLVLRIVSHGHSILLTGDIMALGQRELMASPRGVRSDILIAPHHGSFEPTTADFIAAVDPAVILASNKRALTRRQQTLDQLAAGRELYRTHNRGAVTIRIDAAGRRTVQTYRPRPGA